MTDKHYYELNGLRAQLHVSCTNGNVTIAGFVKYYVTTVHCE